MEYRGVQALFLEVASLDLQSLL